MTCLTNIDHVVNVNAYNCGKNWTCFLFRCCENELWKQVLFKLQV